MNRGRCERGSMAIELAILTPVLVAAIMVIAGGARFVDAQGQTDSAAFAAARAASLTTNRNDAVAAGTTAAKRSLSDRGHACVDLDVSIDAGAFAAGGSVTATVTCTTDLSDLVGVGLPGSRTFTATATVPLEEHRYFDEP
jgi:hypothetical protein